MLSCLSWVLGLIQVNFTQNLTVSGRNPGVLSLLTWQFAIPKHPSVLKHWQRLCLILLLIFVDILRMMFTYCDYKYSITYKKSCQNRDQILVMFTTCYWTFCEGIQKDKLVTQSVWTQYIVIKWVKLEIRILNRLCLAL